MNNYENKWLEDFLIRSTWATNAIEGNRLSLFQTMFIILEGKVLAQPNHEIRLRDIKEIENGAAAFNAMIYALEKKWPVDERLMKTFHQEITKNLLERSGQWKFYENKVVGANFKPVVPKEVPQAIRELLAWYNQALKSSDNLLATLADFHIKFEMIHPFADGNGRTGRLLLNYQLMSFNYFPVSFSVANEYLSFLIKASEEETNWKEAKAPQAFVSLIENLLTIEKERNDICKTERELGLTQDYYRKNKDDSTK